MLTYFFLAILAVFFGNLSSNVLLLWVLGRRAESLKKQQEMREKTLNYIRLES
jgi:hypothetical protein